MDFFTFDCSAFDVDSLQSFAGHQDENLQLLEKLFHTQVVLRNDQLKIAMTEDFDSEQAIGFIQACFDWIEKHHSLSKGEVEYLFGLGQSQQLDLFAQADLSSILRLKSGKMIYPRTLGQSLLHGAMKSSEVVFAVGPAGTGKTYLAVAYAVSLLKEEKISRIILTRPAVEAGESLGFLPGDMKEKVDPYLQPLYDALNEMLGTATVERLMEKKVIEIAPLAFMRGRTLNDCAVILDEAQNTTRMQMKMFLTRLGRNSRMIITGDPSQVDLIKKRDSGLIHAARLLKNVEGVAVVEMANSDIVRNPLVSRILERYDGEREE